MQDDIVILEEDAASVGVREINKPTDALKKKFAALEIKKEEKAEPPKPVLHKGTDKIYALPGYMYKLAAGRPSPIAQVAYQYFEGKSIAHQEAISMWHGETPVFACRQEDLDVFKRFLEKHEVVVAAGFSLFILTVPDDNSTMGSFINDSVTGLVFQSKTCHVRGEQLSFKVNIGSPLDSSMTGFFESIGKMIDRNTRGMRDELAEWRGNLVEILNKRSEEVFNYLSDFKALPGKEELHSLIIDAHEARYTEDHAHLLSTKTAIKNLEKKIADVRGQLPSGRRGIMVKKSYMEAAILGELLEDISCRRDVGALTLTLTMQFKKELVVEGINYGRPLLWIKFVADRNAGRDRSYISAAGATSVDLRAFLHPHMRGEESWCLGTYIVPIGNALMSGNLPMVVSLAWQYLSTYNAGSPLVALDACRQQMDGARPRDIVVRRK